MFLNQYKNAWDIDDEKCIDNYDFKMIFQDWWVFLCFVFQNSDMFWKPTVAIQADAGSFLACLQRSLSGYKCDTEWPESLKERDNEKEEANRSDVFYGLWKLWFHAFSCWIIFANGSFSDFLILKWQKV